MEKTKVGINGFGRIGRQVLKAINERHSEMLQVVAINDLADADANAHLFRYDSTYARYPGTVEVVDGGLVIDSESVRVSNERNPGDNHWRDCGRQARKGRCNQRERHKGRVEEGGMGAFHPFRWAKD